MAKNIIVDNKDIIIGHKDSSEITVEDIYRVSVLWITNTKKDVLLSQRALTKKHDPGKWEPAVAGTIEEGETYESNIIKETKEEIGMDVRAQDLTIGPKLFLDGARDWKFFCQIFMYQCDRTIDNFILDPHEVIGLRWFSTRELEQLLKEKPDMFVNNFVTIVSEMRTI